ncbi:MAG: molybdopterin molybdotransferase MoeA [Chloroflexi bacterium]|nr:molybdopterin molybdotransferase MoeA [Chloroflexota bacterium]
MISYNEAISLVLKHTPVLGVDEVSLLDGVDRIVAGEMIGRVDSPSADASLKDGYAIRSNELVHASEGTPVILKVVGSVAAGGEWTGRVQSGEAVRILSGAPVPDGADAVVAEEFTQLDEYQLTVFRDAHQGRNILPQGTDIQERQELVSTGDRLTPPTVGYLAAAGFQTIPVYKHPRVAILATGDEVVAPGTPLKRGKLYASNLVTLGAWCRRYSFEVETLVVADDEALIREGMEKCLNEYDALITSGGAWSGDRDLVVAMLDELGWEKYFHRARMGPGKAAAFGLAEGKPVFCLPGGPPSNHIAFLELALPGLMKMSGMKKTSLPVTKVQLAKTIHGQVNWTQFVHGTLAEGDDYPQFYAAKSSSRLQMMANADAIVIIPEGVEEIVAGTVVLGQVFASHL